MKTTTTGSDHAVADEILTEAATWLMELHEGPLGPGQRARLDQWRQRSPEHERAWEKASILLDKFHTLPPSGASALRELAMPDRRKAIKVLAATLMLGPAAWLVYRAAPWTVDAAHYATAVGERRDITLDDGTRVSLNTDTQLDVAFGGAERLLRLRRGEIMITTAKDRAQLPRPFLVAVDEGRIRALGTRFSVRQLKRSSHVAVFEGAVELSPADQPAAAMILPASMESTFSRSQVAAATPCDGSAVAWTGGMLVADRMPLARFASELGRYRSGSLQVDPGIAGLAISGVFPLTDTDLTLSLLEQTMPVRMQYLTRYWVRITAR